MTSRASIEGNIYGDKGQLTVLPWDGEVYKRPNFKKGGGDKIYKLYCTECAKDPELYGDAIFKGKKQYLEMGVMPCGCNPNYRPTLDQHIVKIKRICVEKNYSFIHLEDDGTSNHSSKNLTLRCNVCDKEFASKPTRLYAGTGCPFCAHKQIGLGNSKLDEELIASFMSTGSYVSGTTFTRTDRKKGNTYIWEVYCPICSVDEYVEAGVCDGKFESVISTLQQGALPCRCAKNHIRTAEQREYEVKKILQNEPQYTFIRWDSGYKSTKSYAWFNCKYHGEWKARLNNFISDNATRCPVCANNGGYNRKEDGYVYVLAVKGRNKHFTGYGISNSPNKRITEHVRNLKSFEFVIEQKEIFKMTGEQAADLEKKIKQEFPVDPQLVEGFKREATYAYLYQDVIDFIKDEIESHKQEK